MRVLDRSSSHGIAGALALAQQAPHINEEVRLLPQMLRTLTEVECHVLARVAVHCWTHQGRIPYRAPTPHQRTVAYSLAAPGIRLLEVVTMSDFDHGYRLSHRGEVVAHKVFNVVPMVRLMAQECTFDRMCRLMRNDWEGYAWEMWEMGG